MDYGGELMWTTQLYQFEVGALSYRYSLSPKVRG